MPNGHEFLQLSAISFHAIGEAMTMLLALKNDVSGFEHLDFVVVGAGGELPGRRAMVGCQHPQSCMSVGAFCDIENAFAVARDTIVLKFDSRKKIATVASLQVETD